MSHAVGDRWFVDETYVKVADTWRWVYRAIDRYGQVIDVYVSKKRDTKAASRFASVTPGAFAARASGSERTAHRRLEQPDQVVLGDVTMKEPVQAGTFEEPDPAA